MGILYPFCLLHSEFDKNANSACKRQGDLVISSWFSDLEFAFFVRWLRSAHFLIFGGQFYEKKNHGNIHYLGCSLNAVFVCVRKGGVQGQLCC